MIQSTTTPVVHFRWSTDVEAATSDTLMTGVTVRYLASGGADGLAIAVGWSTGTDRPTRCVITKCAGERLKEEVK